jgi:deoxycytidine triphosphate deaminase
MDARVAAAMAGLLRASSAVGEEMSLIESSHPRQGFPHTPLVEALPRASELHSKAEAFCEELAGLSADHVVTTLTGTSKHLASLHLAAQGIRSAVEWSSRFSAIDWWVSRRVYELGLTKRVLVAPGRLGDFSIERTSRFREVLVELGQDGRLLSGDDGELIADFHPYRDKLADFHLLRVPPSDGIAPAWHPLVLGHEVAHLKYTDLAVRLWTAALPPENYGELVKAAIADAQNFKGQTGSQLITRSSWFGQLERWLAEIACDSVAVLIYGPAGLEALRTILAAYAIPVPSSSHPLPDLRVAIQEAEDQEKVEAHRPLGDPFDSPEARATNALIDLALPMRDAVRAELADAFGPLDIADDVAQSAEDSLDKGLLPSSSDWPEGEVRATASAIESGLVRGLWRSNQTLAGGLPATEAALKRNVAFVSQAIDGLEFAARFDGQRDDLGVAKQERMPLPNVLWLSKEGVATRPDFGDAGPAHDLRLGRHFIVFQRTSVSDISALGPRRKAAIQRSVEVGWGDEFVLHPAELVLAVTFESLRLDKTCTAQVLSRSSLGRLGLLSATAVQVQPGYHGSLTLELVNLANVPLRLTPGQRVAQIVPAIALGSTEGYKGGYQGSGAKPQLSLSTNDWEADILSHMRNKPL